ncbi:hypothetical protein [Spirosoma utsteinense]|uniref:Uncharacterized protein n=1 Tax=Spirosoma utsteinense TaxID=2585773 RepID=A0ABR6WEC8_9BACT|nr:hypothetical protein [Spirosoma utsteinense]MBC3787447.1 hypothetical protein [Spirosoma utsteinense]MBC3794533.1 hypothetical protein [Spirosoma utsteinense]
MNTQQDIIDIFSILHDGTIESWTGNKEKLLLKVGCLYLAELIDKDFECFYVEVEQIKKIEFFAWMNPIDQEQKIFTELEEIFKTELEILSAEKSEDDILIVCNQHDTAFEYCGGKLTINCESIKIFDERHNILKIDEFDKICKQYWDKCGRN